ncbi:hypothetical protein MWU54_03840 [Marivita sp. S6314]|uniref:hypothetical protein n=1 Tax=Marivita sp. S6314 TaxID=2926406 RepID=UPI001FF689B1|nr:hypothetical protein [Marivita sp. S6314]MCK0149141.1 hypothetical protein [Marivita sp. S6314]
MPGYNKQFELTVDDMDLIETALRHTKQSLSTELMNQAENPSLPGEEAREIDASVKKITELLGRLHNQKQFYRPRVGAYVSG